MRKFTNTKTFDIVFAESTQQAINKFRCKGISGLDFTNVLVLENNYSVLRSADFTHKTTIEVLRKINNA